LLFLAAGLILLFLGRKLFWLFVATVGFLLGTFVVPYVLPSQPQSVVITISLIMGLVGILLAVLLQKIAVGLAGFIAGGYIVYSLLTNQSIDAGQMQWLAILAGAIIGAVLAGSMFDWALIFLTSISGSILITQGIGLASPVSTFVLIGLFLIGILVQGNIRSKD
jgi:hypothetical protein